MRETQGIVQDDRLSDTIVTANVTVGVMTCLVVQWQVRTRTGWSSGGKNMLKMRENAFRSCAAQERSQFTVLGMQP